MILSGTVEPRPAKGHKACLQDSLSGHGVSWTWLRNTPGLLSHDYIGTEHLLLGRTGQCTGVPARALASLGITVEAARRASRGDQRPRSAGTARALPVHAAGEQGAGVVFPPAHGSSATTTSAPSTFCLALSARATTVAVQVLNGLGVGITVRDGGGEQRTLAEPWIGSAGNPTQRCSAWASGSDRATSGYRPGSGRHVGRGPGAALAPYRRGIVRGSRPVKAARRSQSSAPGAG